LTRAIADALLSHTIGAKEGRRDNLHDEEREITMNFARKLVLLAPVLAAAALAGCQSGGTYAPRMSAAPRPTGVEGQWLDSQGVAVSTFSGGSFVTTATDTGNKLSEGTYYYQDQRTVEIEMTSLIRQTRATVACSLVTTNQLNCTNSQGQRFTLTRRAVPAIS
jgi:hypothetical protein